MTPMSSKVERRLKRKLNNKVFMREHKQVPPRKVHKLHLRLAAGIRNPEILDWLITSMVLVMPHGYHEIFLRKNHKSALSHCRDITYDPKSGLAIITGVTG